MPRRGLKNTGSKGYDTKIVRMAGKQFDLVVAESYDRFSKAMERLDAVSGYRRY